MVRSLLFWPEGLVPGLARFARNRAEQMPGEREPADRRDQLGEQADRRRDGGRHRRHRALRGRDVRDRPIEAPEHRWAKGDRRTVGRLAIGADEIEGGTAAGKRQTGIGATRGGHERSGVWVGKQGRECPLSGDAGNGQP